MEAVLNELYSNSGHQQLGGDIPSYSLNQYNGLKSLSKNLTLSGGDKSTIEDVGRPEYIKNESFKKFMESFYLIRYVCNTKGSSVYIIPPASKIDKMVQEFNKLLESENIQPGTSEAVYFAFNNKKYIQHLRCIFTIHADSGENYRLDDNKFNMLSLCYGHKKAKSIKMKNIHNYRNFKAVKRTNIAGEQYKFLYKDEKSIIVSNDINSDEANKSATTVKLIARCDNGIFIFQGDIPEPKSKYERSLTGGNKQNRKNLTKEEYFKKCLEADRTGKYFVLSMVKAAKDSKVNLKNYYDDFSSNFVHSAFKMCFDNNITIVPNKNYTKQSLIPILNDLCKNMKLINKNINTGKFTEIINNKYLEAINGCDNPLLSTKRFMKSLKDIYRDNILEFNADLSTALYNQKSEDLNHIFDCVKEVNNFESSELSNIGKLEYNILDHTNYTSSLLNKLIKEALADSPFIGTVSKTYYPMIGGDIDGDVDRIFDNEKEESEEGEESEENENEEEGEEDKEGNENEGEEEGEGEENVEELEGGKKKKTVKKSKKTSCCGKKKQNEPITTEFDLTQYL